MKKVSTKRKKTERLVSISMYWTLLKKNLNDLHIVAVCYCQTSVKIKILPNDYCKKKCDNISTDK